MKNSPAEHPRINFFTLRVYVGAGQHGYDVLLKPVALGLHERVREIRAGRGGELHHPS